jgi:hypothetical protein
MKRYDFTGDARTLAEIAAANPTIDHFHCVEYIECHDGLREFVSHFDVWRDQPEKEIEILNERRGDANHVKANDYNRAVGDEWHER